MQTSLPESFAHSPDGREADSILRSCVHCGFCTATCPTYLLLGDELDGPRGRIYLVKQALEGFEVTRRTQNHLDRCLTCRACETTCPSGVRYGRLLDIGRHLVESKVRRPWHARVLRRVLRMLVPMPRRFAVFLRAGQLLAPVMPRALRRKIPAKQRALVWPEPHHGRVMLVLEGCAQRVATPNTNAVTARVLDRLGISLLRTPAAGCCGALSQHLCAQEEALDAMRRNIDAWWPHVEGGAEAIIVSASGCSVMVKDYGVALRHDPLYADKARRVAALARDLSEILSVLPLEGLNIDGQGRRVAFHSPCTLQHGQRIHGRVEASLRSAGYVLTEVADSHLCCGSAGTYSLLQPQLARRLLQNKLTALQHNAPECIVTANIGCQLQLAGGAQVPVGHWIELFDEMSARGLLPPP
jgi:glycolate oxidase iron-sulfur subunit